MNPNNAYNKIKSWKAGEWAGVILLALSLLLLFRAVFACFSTDIWYDELFTMGLTDHSFGALTGITARDVHPPFYYYYVKLIRELGAILFPSFSGIITAKLGSVFFFFLLWLYGVTKVRRNFGFMSAGIFCFCIVAMPQLSQYTTEIRMYSCALFLVTAAFLHTFDLLRQNRGQDWFFLFLFGILAAYTHYFAAVAAAMIYGYLMIGLLQIRKQTEPKTYRKLWGRIGLMICLSVLAYLPWLFAVLNQVSQVKEEYWILPLTIRSIGGCVKFLLKPAFASETVNIVLAVVFFLLYAGAFFHALFYNKLTIFNKKIKTGQTPEYTLPSSIHAEQTMIVSGLLVLTGVVIFGFVASFLIRPVFIYRYMLPAMGIFWLCFAVAVSRLLYSRSFAWKAVFFVLIFITGYTNFKAFSGEENWKKNQMKETVKALNTIAPEDAVIFNFNHVQGILGYYLENDTYLWGAEAEALIREMFDGMFSIYSVEEIRALLGSERNVWFVGSGNAREELIAEWEKSGLAVEEKGSFLLERYWFNLYKFSNTVYTK